MSQVFQCPVCESPAIRRFAQLETRDYWRCETCVATFVDTAQLPDIQLERAQYALHQNDPDDTAYRAFLGRLATPLLQRLQGLQAFQPLQTSRSQQGLYGLDYGCGPGPALAAMLREAGHTMAVYDPLFYDDRSVLTGPYDFITCTEVAEHFHQPAQEFARLDRLLAPGGWLAVMTGFTPDDADFARWHYRLDPTHVVFYREATFNVLAQRYGWRCEIPCANVALLQKWTVVSN
ncbi:MAG: class I SAM-dependent methyltransferase [Pseudomonadales bacterium]|nr:class I SAM-dependent methyltransferase [Pseudomonadales bacterium]